MAVLSASVIGLLVAAFFLAQIRHGNQVAMRYPSGPLSKPSNIVLIVVDTERADVTNPYGAKNPTTPFLQDVARHGVVFSHAFAPAPWTVPSMFSMVTGLYPSEHGVTKGVSVREDTRQVLNPQATTLAELLRDAGLETFGVNTNFTLQPRFGFGQGFNHFVGHDFAYLPFPNLALKTLLPQIRNAERYFLWLHYFDPHQPYDTYSPWFTEWNRGRIHSYAELLWDIGLQLFRRQKGMTRRDHVTPKQLEMLSWRLAKAATGKAVSSVYKQFRKTPQIFNKDYRRFIKAAYMSCVRKTDDAMKKALRGLKIDDQTLVIITSDHGEELFDRGRLGHHMNSLYQELIGIPLIMLLPGRAYAGTVIDTPVSLVDVTPTVLDLLGMDVPEGLSGQSLKPLIEGKPFAPRALFSEVYSPERGTRCLIEYPWKYMNDTQWGEQMLYNLNEDAYERNNLVRTHHKRAASMRKKLTHWTETVQPRWPPSDGIELDKREVERLKALGYLTSSD